jgi:hypothetical protein
VLTHEANRVALGDRAKAVRLALLGLGMRRCSERLVRYQCEERPLRLDWYGLFWRWFSALWVAHHPGAEFLYEDFTARVEALQRLRAEQEALAAGRTAAEEERDSWRLAEIDERARSLREEADSAQARLFRLYAERARAQLPEAEEAAAAARAEYDRAHAEYLKAHELVNRLGVESNNTGVRVVSLRQSVTDNVRRALELERSLPPRLRGADVRRP